MKIHDEALAIEYPDTFKIPIYDANGNDTVNILQPGQVEWPFSSSQVHWKGTGPTPNPISILVPGISHTHIEGWFPNKAEVGAGPITCFIIVRMFKTAGKINFVNGEFMGPQGAIPFTEVVINQPFPLIGDPNGLVSFTGHVKFDPSLATVTIAKHGYFNCRIWTRTEYDNGDNSPVEHWFSLFSTLDTSQPEFISGEGFMEFAAKVSAQAKDDESGGFGLQLSEFRGQEARSRALPPILVPFNVPQTIYPLTYNYKFLPNLIPHYALYVDSSPHMDIEGILLDSTETAIQNGVSVQAVLDPVKIAASPLPMGATPGRHRIFVIWWQDTGAGSVGFAPNQRLVSVLVFEVRIGPNPIGPVTVVVPNMVGLTKEVATSTLSNLGLTVNTTSQSDPVILNDIVISQTPVVGSNVNKGSSVSLVVSSGPAAAPIIEWVVRTPTHMQAKVNGVFVDRWQICNPDEPMVPGVNCPEIVTKPVV